ncbi:fatty acid synthase alpha subunit Lsd1, partial [Linderina macrospora]
MEPASRLGSESEATAWLDSVAQAYAAKAGIQLGSAGGATPVAVNATVAVSGPVSDQSHRDFVIQQINVMARYAGIDLRAGDRLADDARAVAKASQAKLDAISEELGDDLVEGVVGKFEARKARKFDSAWNWARQDAVAWIYGVLLGDQPEEDAQRLLALTNRSSLGLLKLVAATASVLQRNSGDAASVRAAAFAQSLYKAIEAKLGAEPIYKELAPSVRPHVDISATGEIKYSEVPREGEPTIVDYVERMRQEVDKKDPFVFLQKHDRISKWSLDHANTSVYFDVLAEVGRSGLSFAGKTAL